VADAIVAVTDAALKAQGATMEIERGSPGPDPARECRRRRFRWQHQTRTIGRLAGHAHHEVELASVAAGDRVEAAARIAVERAEGEARAHRA